MVAQREGNKDTAPFAGLAYGGKSLLVLRVGSAVARNSGTPRIAPYG